MPEPGRNPEWPKIRAVATIALVGGVIIVALKFGVFFLTNSAAVLSDALESIINVVAAGVLLFTLRLANKPPDREHPYGHGKAEFMAIAFEGSMILLAGALIAFEAIRRLLDPPELRSLGLGTFLLAGVGLLSLGLALYILRAGRRLGSDALVADGRHLMTDVFTTGGAVAGLILVNLTGLGWLDPAIALIFAAVIVFTSWRLLGQSIAGLMDRADPEDDKAVRTILDEEVRAGAIAGYHKVRVRRSGVFTWVDMHLHVTATMTVHESHELASRIEHRIERTLKFANATAHVEPALSQEDEGATGADTQSADR